jgi:hypothetical protein
VRGVRGGPDHVGEVAWAAIRAMPAAVVDCCDRRNAGSSVGFSVLQRELPSSTWTTERKTRRCVGVPPAPSSCEGFDLEIHNLIECCSTVRQ